jgi:2-phosphosulfolactate phosphatase
MTSPHAQNDYDLRLEWSPQGLQTVVEGCRAVIVVDVLIFSTWVEIACSRGALVYPSPWRGDDAQRTAAAVGGIAAVGRLEVDSEHPLSLSPTSLTDVPAGTRLVLPSRNGAQVSLAAGRAGVMTIAGCLRNASAVAAAARKLAPVAVIAAGERRADGGLRPCVEDLLGAGAIIDQLKGDLSPEAEVAAAAWRALRGDLEARLLASASGRELTAIGFAADVVLASKPDISATVPVFRDGAYSSEGA